MQTMFHESLDPATSKILEKEVFGACNVLKTKTPICKKNKKKFMSPFVCNQQNFFSNPAFLQRILVIEADI